MAVVRIGEHTSDSVNDWAKYVSGRKREHRGNR